MGKVFNPDYFRTGAGTGGSGLTGGGRFGFDRALLTEARAALRALMPHRERPEPTPASSPRSPPSSQPTQTHPSATSSQEIPTPVIVRAAPRLGGPTLRAITVLTAVAAVVSGLRQLWRWRRAAR